MKKFLVKFFATGLGVGYLPLAPGTWGSLVGVVVYLLGVGAGFSHSVVLPALAAVFAVVVAHQAEKIFAEKDCQKIVIDEVMGQWATYLFAPFSVRNLVIGFVLFRIFDVIKPFPARWFQEKMPGGLGVVGDDVIAGIQAGIVLWGVSMYLTP